MHYPAVFTILSSLAAIAQAGVAPPDTLTPDNIAERSVDSPAVEERAAAACKDNGCKCEKVKQGQVSSNRQKSRLSSRQS